MSPKRGCLPKVDLVMWTKNGEKTLPMVLDRINEVIPDCAVNNRFIVDDCSLDHTREIAVVKGWAVLMNEGSGISDGANTALKYVESEFFCSFEQDLLLCRDWWRLMRVVPCGVAALSGVRVSSMPSELRVLQLFLQSNYLRKGSSLFGLKRESSFLFGKTLDNTVWNASVLREVGGFPKTRLAGLDTLLAYAFKRAGYRWLVNSNACSVHLRQSFRQELDHQYFYGESHRELGFSSPLKESLKLLSTSVASPACVFFTREPRLLLTYPRLKLSYYRGFMEGSK